MAEVAEAPLQSRQDVGGIFSRVRRHLPIIALCIIAGAALAFCATLLMPKTYTAAAQLDYSPQETVRAGNQQQSDLLRDAQIDAQIQTVRSLPVAMRVVSALKLDGGGAAAQSAETSAGAAANGKQAVAAALLQNVNSSRVGTTTLFDVSYTDRDALRAATLANAFATAFLENELARKLAESDEIGSRLEARLKQLRMDIEQADANVASYRLRNKLLTLPDSASADQALATMRSELVSARANAAGAQARGSGSLSGVNPGLVAMGPLQAQRAEVARRFATVSSKFGPRHPQYQDAQDELAAIDSQIARESGRLASASRMENAATGSAAGSTAGSLAASVADAERQMARNVAASVELASLQRRAQSARDVYQQLLSTSVEQSANRALVRPDTRLAATAAVPLDPSSPNLPLNVLMGLVLGLAIGLGIAFLRERWTQSITTADDVEVLLGQHYLNSIPTPQSSIEQLRTQDPVEAITLHPLSAYTEAYRNLAASLSFAANRKGGKVIGITSALPKEGKTTTTVNLARVLAMGGAKVLLLDADLRRRSASLLLAPNAKLGVEDVLRDPASLSQAIVTDETGLNLLPIGAQRSTSARIFEQPEFADLIDRLRDTYEYVVIDTAPVLAVVDTRLLLPHLDALALLTRWRATPARAARAAINQIESMGSALAGVTLTMVDLKSQAQAASGDASYYSGYMKDYYNES